MHIVNLLCVAQRHSLGRSRTDLIYGVQSYGHTYVSQKVSVGDLNRSSTAILAVRTRWHTLKLEIRWQNREFKYSIPWMELTSLPSNRFQEP